MPTISSLTTVTLDDADVLAVDDVSGAATGKTAVSALRTKLLDNATSLPFTPDGDIAATDVDAAIVEVRDDTNTKLALKAPDRLTIIDIDDTAYSGGADTITLVTDTVYNHSGTDTARSITIGVSSFAGASVIINMSNASLTITLAVSGVTLYAGDGQNSGTGTYTLTGINEPVTLIWTATDTVVMAGTYGFT